eukprot:6212111-Pleurochrysis_carterae.AAC.8
MNAVYPWKRDILVDVCASAPARLRHSSASGATALAGAYVCARSCGPQTGFKLRVQHSSVLEDERYEVCATGEAGVPTTLKLALFRSHEAIEMHDAGCALPCAERLGSLRGGIHDLQSMPHTYENLSENENCAALEAQITVAGQKLQSILLGFARIR